MAKKTDKNTRTIDLKQPRFAHHQIEITLLKPPQTLLTEGNMRKIQALHLEHLVGRTTDCRMYVRGLDDLDAWPVTNAFFSNGRFLGGTGAYILGPGYIPIDGKYIIHLSDFKRILEEYFTIPEFTKPNTSTRITLEQFAKVIRNARVAQPFKDAVRDLIYK